MAAAFLSRRLSSRLLPLLQNHYSNSPQLLHRSLKSLHSPIPSPHPLFHHHYLNLTKTFSTQTPPNPNPNPNPTEIPNPNPNPNPTEIPTQNLNSTEIPTQNPNPTEIPAQNPNPTEIPAQNPNSTDIPTQNPHPHFKHQEVEGPTVDRDVSSVAKETRQVLETLSRSMFRLSNALGLLGVTHLVLGSYVAYIASPPAEFKVQGIAAFAIPFTAAFLVRRSLVMIIFFRKMEEIGRLQILTLALQVSRTLNVLLLKIKTAAVFCMLGISTAALIIPWLR